MHDRPIPLLLRCRRTTKRQTKREPAQRRPDQRGESMTLAAVGRLLSGRAGRQGVTREAVRQTEIAALRGAREAFQALGITSVGEAMP